MRKNKTKQDWYQYHKKKSGNEAVESSSFVRSARENHRAAESNLAKFLITHPQTLSSSIKKALFGKSQVDLELEKLVNLVDVAKKNLNNEISKAYGSGANQYAENWVERNAEKENLK